jgi:hypothetical protein
MSNTYQYAMQQLGRFGAEGFDLLRERFSELFLSLPDEKQLGFALGAWAKLNWQSFDPPQSAEGAAVILETALANLLKAGKLSLAAYGVSTLGQEEYNSLLARIEPVVAESTEDSHAQAVREFHELPSHEYNQLWKTDAAFRARADAASAAGAL